MGSCTVRICGFVGVGVALLREVCHGVCVGGGGGFDQVLPSVEGSFLLTACIRETAPGFLQFKL